MKVMAVDDLESDFTPILKNTSLFISAFLYSSLFTIIGSKLPTLIKKYYFLCDAIYWHRCITGGILFCKKCRRYNSISMEFKEVSVTKYRIMLRSSKFSNRDRKSE